MLRDERRDAAEVSLRGEERGQGSQQKQAGLPAATPSAARGNVVRCKRPPRCDGSRGLQSRAPASVAHISARLPRCAAAVAFDVVGRGRGALLQPRMPTISTTLFSKLRSSSRDSRDRKARRNSSSRGPDQSRSCLEQDSGSVRFAGSRKPAKFCRVPVDASVEDDLVPLLIKSWGLSPPAAIISVPAVRGCTRDDVFHHDQRGSHHIDPNPSRTPTLTPNLTLTLTLTLTSGAHLCSRPGRGRAHDGRVGDDGRAGEWRCLAGRALPPGHRLADHRLLRSRERARQRGPRRRPKWRRPLQWC